MNFLGLIILYAIPFAFVGVILYGFYWLMRGTRISAELGNRAWNQFGLIVGELLKMNPVYSSKQRELLGEFMENFRVNSSSNFDGIVMERLTSKEEQTNDNFDYDVLNEFLQPAERRTLVMLLFKLAAQDDGIKNDEWAFIYNVMVGLKLNSININYFQRRFGVLRTESDYNQSTYQEYFQRQAYQQSSPCGLEQYFAELGLPSNSTKEQVHAAYRKLALQYHPDLPKNAENYKACVEKMAAINVAYTRLMSSLS